MDQARLVQIKHNASIQYCIVSIFIDQSFFQLQLLLQFKGFGNPKQFEILKLGFGWGCYSIQIKAHPYRVAQEK